MFKKVIYIGHLEGSSIGKGIMTSKVWNGSSEIQRKQREMEVEEGSKNKQPNIARLKEEAKWCGGVCFAPRGRTLG